MVSLVVGYGFVASAEAEVGEMLEKAYGREKCLTSATDQIKKVAESGRVCSEEFHGTNTETGGDDVVNGMLIRDPDARHTGMRMTPAPADDRRKDRIRSLDRESAKSRRTSDTGSGWFVIRETGLRATGAKVRVSGRETRGAPATTGESDSEAGK